MIDVLVADDQDLTRAGLCALINAAPGLRVVGEAADGREAVLRTAALSPEVVVMDIRMPGLDGVAATEHILATEEGRVRPRILMLTTFDLDDYVYAALRAGASGFLLKETSPERLLAAIHTVAAGDSLFAPTVTRRLIEAYTRTPPTVTATPPALDSLTPRELEVLRHVAQGLANTQIADRLVISEATVKTHLYRVLTKLRLTSRTQAVILAYETGLIQPQCP